MQNPLYTTLRPGLLVGLSTSIKGNVTYSKTETEARTLDSGAIIEEWETEKTIKDAAEMGRAIEVRAKARSLVGSVCSATAFGYLCPEDDRQKLDDAFAEAAALCDAFNATALVTRIKFAAVTGRIEPNDAAAIRAINSEVRSLISDMEEGVKNLSVEGIRDAAKRAKQLGNMLSPEAQANLKDALSAARSVATKVNKAADTAAVEVDKAVIDRLHAARTLFLDYDGAAEVQDVADTTSRALDFDPAVVIEREPETAKTPDLELEDMLG